jgi:predicted HD phosphohydrolase
METVQFTRMADGTKEEYALLRGLEAEYAAHLPERILDGLRRLDDGLAGYQVTRLVHSLQTATRAQRDGADVDMVVAALVHDIGDELAPENHSQVAAASLRPYVRAEVTWTVLMHGLFQLRYFGHHVGLDPEEREQHRDHPWYDTCDPSAPTGTRPRSTPPTRRSRSRRSRHWSARSSPGRPSTPRSCRNCEQSQVGGGSSRRSALAASAVASTAARSTTEAR